MTDPHSHTTRVDDPPAGVEVSREESAVLRS
jgi:hypothetical protein